jgi:hypothetical protein
MLGINARAQGVISYLDETDVFYTSGSNLIRLDADTKAQRIVPPSPGAVAVTCLATSANHK